jgi:uncharacterized membrane protein HdeD (DUF308 family)
MGKKKVYVSEETPNVAGNVAILILSLLLIVLGAVMLVTDTIRIIYFCYGAGGCLLVWGIWLISRYFLHHEFQQTTNYGFAVGTMVVILGAIALIRAGEIAEAIPDYLGVLVLLEGVVMLQNTVQLKNLRGKLWVLCLIFSLLSVMASLVILLDIRHLISKQTDLLYLILVVTGVFALISLCLVAICTRRYHKVADRELARHLQESDEWFAGQAQKEAAALPEGDERPGEDAEAASEAAQPETVNHEPITEEQRDLSETE